MAEDPVTSMGAIKPDEDTLEMQAFHLPTPTYWPATLAFGVTLILFGIVTSVIFSAVGVLLLVVGLVGWIGDLLHG